MFLLIVEVYVMFINSFLSVFVTVEAQSYYRLEDQLNVLPEGTGHLLGNMMGKIFLKNGHKEG